MTCKHGNTPLLFLARFVFRCCSALNWLLGWSEEPQWLLELSRVHQEEVGGAGPSPFGSSDVLKLVRSSHEITSCETERRAGHGRVNPPQVSRTNMLRTSGDAHGTSHNIPQPKAGPLHHILKSLQHHAQTGSTSNYASRRNEQCFFPSSLSSALFE